MHEYPDATLALFHGPRCLAALQRRRRARRTPKAASRVSRFDAACRRPVDKWTAAPRLTTSPQGHTHQQKRSTHLVHKPVNSKCSRQRERSQGTAGPSGRRPWPRTPAMARMPPAAVLRWVERPREARESRMPIGPVPPSVRRLHEMAESFGFEMSDADAALYAEMMAGTIQSYRRLDAMQETKPPVKYPRAGSYRPGPAEDPYKRVVREGRDQGRGRRCARRQDGRHQGRDLRRGLSHDQRRQGARGLYPGYRRHRGDPRARCRRDHSRQDQQRGLLVLRRQPHLGLWPGPQPAQDDPLDRCLVQRQRSRGRGRRYRHGHRRRPGRLDPHPRRAGAASSA